MIICEQYGTCCDWKYCDKIEDLDEEGCQCSHILEVEEVNHAKWVKVSNYPEYECSNCHFPAAKNDYGYYAICDTYCRACGAKMDLN